MNTVTRPGLTRSVVTLGGVALLLVVAVRWDETSVPRSGDDPLLRLGAGVALASVLLGGYRMLPAVLAGAFLGEWWAGGSWLSGLAVALGAAGQAALGKALLDRVMKFQPALERLGDVRGLAVLGAGGATVLSAACRAALPPWTDPGTRWWTAWLADGLGVLAAAPLLLAWGSRPRPGWPVRLWVAAGVGLVLLVVACLVAFGGFVPEPAAGPATAFLPFPVLVWAALRLGPRGAAVAVCVTAAFAAWGTARGVGPFGEDPWPARALLAGSYVGLFSITGLLLAATAAELRQREETVRERQAFLQQLADFSPNVLFVYDLRDAQHVFVNRAVGRILGFGPDTVTRMGSDVFRGLMHPDDFAKLRAKLRRLAGLREGEVIETEYRMRHADGAWRWLQERTTVFARHPDGSVRLLLGSCQDVTVRKRTEEALQESQNLFRAFMNHCPALAYLKDESGRLLFANPLFETAFGLEPGGWQGKTDREVWPAEAVVPMGEHDQAVLRSGQPVAREETLSREGSERVWLTIKFPVRNAAGQRLLAGMALDVTDTKRAEADRRRLDAQLQQAQKLESLAVLAGGVAHDFNNLLTGILGNATLAQLELAPESSLRLNLDQIETAALRAAELCKQMLAYSGKGRFRVELVSPTRLVGDMKPLLETVVSRRATLSYLLAEGLPAVRADAGQLQQVLLNLVTNASDALGERGGTIAITTGTVEADEGYLSGAFLDDGLAPGRYVFLEVTDNGCGMDEATRAKIFDPFFSTKFTGRGLGLAAVLGIVRGHRGAIRVLTELGKGSTFRVLFPVEEERSAPA
jgi:PAS domain S-box-containing protein